MYYFLSVEPTGVKYALSNEYPFGAFVSVIEIVPNGSVGKPSTKKKSSPDTLYASVSPV